MTNQPFAGFVETGGNFTEITPDIGHPLPPDDDKMKDKSQTNVGLPAITLDAFGFRIFRKK